MTAVVTISTRAQRGFATRSGRRVARGPWQGSRVDAGFTLIEIVITLAIVGLIMGLGIKGFRTLTRSDLRAASTHLAGTMRFLFDRASTTGKTHRLVLDLESGRYWAEASDDKFYVPRDTESPETARRREEMEAEQDEEKRAAAEAEASASSTAPANSSFDMSKLEIGEFQPKHARFAAFKELAFKPQTLKKTVALHSVFTPRLSEAVTAGRAYVYFFPMGQTEPAIVTLSDTSGETIYSLVVHPLTGRVKIYDQEVKPLPQGQRTDDEGNSVQ